ncbi:hypothetical protein ABH931_005688 [Streptacidiphilus sp. MAP12-33]|uniref:hypothetical protein n=1 Tax=Streptacidiphilus sp. MAP12-33 TaxID=3156266 RepID=UPI00351954F5
MEGNSGINAQGGSQVWGNAVASGRGSSAEVHQEGPVRADAPRPTVQEVRTLLAQLAAELGRSDHAEREALIEEVDAADAELGTEQPRLGRVRRLVTGLGSAVEGFTRLAGLVAAIEQAVRGL